MNRLLLLLSLSLICIAAQTQTYNIDITINDEIDYEYRMSVSGDDSIVLRVGNPEADVAYRFSKVKFRWFILKTKVSFWFLLTNPEHWFKNAEELAELQEATRSDKKVRWRDLEEIDLPYSDFSKDGRLVIPFSSFDHPYTTRVQFKIQGVEILENKAVRKASSREFDFVEEYELWPSYEGYKE